MRTMWLLLLSMAPALPIMAASTAAPSLQVMAQAGEVPRQQAVTPAAAVPRARAPAPTTASVDAPSTLSIAGYRIQPPGQFHRSESVARDGERWLALRIDGTGAALVPMTVQVAMVEDALVDAPGERSGQAVSPVPQDDAVRMFLRGPAFIAGALEEATLDMPPGDGRRRIDLALSFRDARYRLWSECTSRAAAPIAGQVQFDCRIVLREAVSGSEQVLVRMDGYANAPGEAAWLGNDASPALLFAGDLDRDGELDLLFDTTHHYNISRPTLFLSSQAGPGELLREVATHEATGC